MARERRREKKDLGSLIPEIKGEEKRLEDLLASAREEAARIGRDAEAEAQSRIRAAQAALPRVIAAEREARVAALRREAAAAARAEEDLTRGQEESARAAIGRAVAEVVARVWPGDEP